MTREQKRAVAEEALSKLNDQEKHHVMTYMIDQIEQYISEEREACALTAEEWTKSLPESYEEEWGWFGKTYAEKAAEAIAAAIRARSAAEKESKG